MPFCKLSYTVTYECDTDEEAYEHFVSLVSNIESIDDLDVEEWKVNKNV